MALDYVHRPIGDRTSFLEEHEPSPFSATFHQTMRLLEDELWHLNGENVVIEVDVVPSQIRRDGKLNERARVLSPAVRIVFDSVHGQLTYATDRFVRNYKGPMDDWKHNLRAIALGLEALRKVDRYGIAQHGEQYTGYLALEAGAGGIALGGMTASEALTVLREYSGMPLLHHQDDELRKAYRIARGQVHPDRFDGENARDMWDRLETAAKVLGLSS